MKKDSKKGKVSKLVKIMLSTFSALGAFAILGTVTNEKYHWLTPSSTTKDDEPLNSSIIAENGIKITGMTKNAAENSDGYGIQTITFQCDEDSTDNVLTKLIYTEDEAEVETGIISLDKNDSSIQVRCNKPFTKQITLVLYARNNENVNAKITLDFLEKLTVTLDYPLFHGEYAQSMQSGKTKVETTGGTITVDKTVKNELFTVNFKELNEYIKPIFQDNAHVILGDYISKGCPDNVKKMMVKFDDGSSSFISKGWQTGNKTSTCSTDDNATGFLGMSPFNATYFLKNIKYVYYNEQYIHANISVSALDLMQANKTAYDALLEAFTTRNIFKYSCTVNNVDYVAYSRIRDKNVLIKNITSITANTSALTF